MHSELTFAWVLSVGEDDRSRVWVGSWSDEPDWQAACCSLDLGPRGIEFFVIWCPKFLRSIVFLRE